ncbi:hypothetical protein PHYSODRAFT_472527 [Phytophthora sojae]|uniref:Uncharacterized protein n=1 Tax=Phytophthora sojae (strain P6497) TaxID=1094619 RepID=G4YNV8_PHYSP|nr:hypothetical protein PHYSODRAFT_472527 [Phytophthora sojae]EGZ30666.1 hypothetical protein PHYSODRAFT_472527 [Phytophthora sojae]|eukprot:XP_009517941.1 hypothetical protein PHYSODRAFT_472527 [Phytophthora sojae]
MSSFVKIDQTCLVQDGLNSRWAYTFPGSACNFQDVEASIQSISLYNSEFNVDSIQFANTSFQIEVPTAATTSVISVNLVDGYYLYTDINRNIQTALVNAGAYLIDSNGNNVFYLQIEENSTYYACQLDCSPTPTSLPTGYTRPTTGLYSSGGTGLPTTTRVPRLIINNAAFGNLLGFTSGTYPTSPTTSATSLLSNTIPQISPTSSYVVRCDLIKNDFVASGDIMSVFDKVNSTIGKQIQYFPSHETWCRTHDGPRSTVSISIWNQNDQIVHFRDTSVNIMLLLRKRRA